MRTLNLFYIAVILVVVVATYYFIKGYKKGNTKFEAIDLIPFFGAIIGISLGILIVLFLFSSSVTIVYEKGHSWKHDGASYLGHFSYNQDGISVSIPAKWFGYSLYNASDKTLVLHPVVYGNPTLSEKEKQTYTILPHEYARIPDNPSFYFERVAPISYSKGSGSVKWVLLEEGQEVENGSLTSPWQH